jgi:hypothetical protein
VMIRLHQRVGGLGDVQDTRPALTLTKAIVVREEIPESDDHCIETVVGLVLLPEHRRDLNLKSMKNSHGTRSIYS